MKKILFLITTVIFFAVSCSSGDDNETGASTDTFNRQALLENIADNIAIPAYQNLANDIEVLKTAASTFVATPNESNLQSIRTAWLNSYVSWQSVSVFEIGKAEELSFRNFMNVFPVSASEIEANITSGTYDLNAVSKDNEQGFGALDYLLNGLSDSNTEIIAFYVSNTNADAYKKYLTDVVDRMNDLTTQVLTDWTSGYRDTFVSSNGSSATSSLDKLVNDYVFHYEKHLRAGKIGIPAGVFSGSVLEDRVEAFYKGDVSKTLFNANLTAMQDLFNGKHFGKNTSGESFKTYLDFLNTIKEGEDLSTLINNQFESARSTGTGLSDDFSAQVRTNNSLMTQTYDELQKNVVLLKVDMVQAMSVRITFIDADGD
ncbi:peptidase M75 superfamily protein [Aquimarina aggregata]|uniref:Peptidase M75 superfamily protein n=1 Tax=Aquimarina aggregata TaxID=1642818 RepID=A0A162WXB2_9FLAO|nr:imelysin family protein [Aquimarina aggregata]KZS38321.1 peptidase M75 superfamily protein [Aquimarina aggregata]